MTRRRAVTPLGAGSLPSTSKPPPRGRRCARGRGGAATSAAMLDRAGGRSPGAAARARADRGVALRRPRTRTPAARRTAGARGRAPAATPPIGYAASQQREHLGDASAQRRASPRRPLRVRGLGDRAHHGDAPRAGGRRGPDASASIPPIANQAAALRAPRSATSRTRRPGARAWSAWRARARLRCSRRPMCAPRRPAPACASRGPRAVGAGLRAGLGDGRVVLADVHAVGPSAAQGRAGR